MDAFHALIEASLRAAPSPSFVVSEALLEKNLAVLARVKRETGCRVLLALKGFAMFRVFPLLREALDGVCASGPHEARLGREEFGKAVHTYAPAYSEEDIEALLATSDHLVFNSIAQWRRFRARVAAAPRPIRCGLRINPECSTAATPLYDPCAPGSRLGVTRAELEGAELDGISGLHFHTLCEQNADALETTLAAVEARFGDLIPRMAWMNFGGGHHITRADYEIDRLIGLVRGFRERFDGIEVILEPGEAVALDAGVLVATVLDVVKTAPPVAILDVSATAHMPDVLEMPYRPRVVQAGEPGDSPYVFRLGGLSCLAGDVIGDYAFPRPLGVGDRVVFEDMAHYTMVKTTTFNGVRLPSIALLRRDGELEIVRRFGYADYRDRIS